MNDLDAVLPTQDERVMAALAHVSALLPMMGVIAPILIWITQKEKSKYVAFQALQALAYQLTMILAWFTGMACYMCSFFGMFGLAVPFSGPSAGSEPSGPLVGLLVAIPFIIFGLIFVGGFAFMIYGIVGAVMTFQGKPFRYVILGRSVERFMQPKQEEGPKGLA